jgi:hypothetical protein
LASSFLPTFQFEFSKFKIHQIAKFTGFPEIQMQTNNKPASFPYIKKCMKKTRQWVALESSIGVLRLRIFDKMR